MYLVAEIANPHKKMLDGGLEEFMKLHQNYYYYLAA